MTTETPTAPTARTRASDAEREETVARLHEALGQGRLDLAETEECVAAAYASRHRDELPVLLADLPQGSDANRAWSGPPTWAELWTSAVWQGRTAVLGAGAPPTPGQCRSAAWLVVLAVAWMVLCAFLGAAVVA